MDNGIAILLVCLALLTIGIYGYIRWASKQVLDKFYAENPTFVSKKNRLLRGLPVQPHSVEYYYVQRAIETLAFLVMSDREDLEISYQRLDAAQSYLRDNPHETTEADLDEIVKILTERS